MMEMAKAYSNQAVDAEATEIATATITKDWAKDTRLELSAAERAEKRKDLMCRLYKVSEDGITTEFVKKEGKYPAMARFKKLRDLHCSGGMGCELIIQAIKESVDRGDAGHTNNRAKRGITKPMQLIATTMLYDVLGTDWKNTRLTEPQLTKSLDGFTFVDFKGVKKEFDIRSTDESFAKMKTLRSKLGALNSILSKVFGIKVAKYGGGKGVHYAISYEYEPDWTVFPVGSIYDEFDLPPPDAEIFEQDLGID
jgi:hypothetical protein